MNDAISEIEGLQAGQYAGWIFETDEALKSGLVSFVQTALPDKEAVLLVVDADQLDSYYQILEQEKLSSNDIICLTLDELLSEDGSFDPKTAAAELENVRAQVFRDTKRSLRVLMDMSWVFGENKDPGLSLEFGTEIRKFLSAGSSIVLGQCDRRQFSPSQILDILTSFPYLVLNDKICGNAYFVAQESQLLPERHEQVLDRMLAHLEDLPLASEHESDAFGPKNTLQMLEAIIDSMGFGVIVADTKGNMIVCNKTAQSILGYGLSDLPLEERVRKIGNYLPDKVTPYPVDQLPIARAIRGESDDEVEIFICNENKPEGVWVRTTGRPIRDRSGVVRGGVVVFRNISSTKIVQEKNAKLEARMAQTQKLEGLGLLAGGIAHDFNNLLMGVLGNAGLALLETKEDSALQTRVEQIKTGAMRLSELTRQLLAYSGQGTFTEEPLDLSSLVEEIQDLLRTVISKKAVLEGQFPRDIPIIHADATQLRQIVINLITNASDALNDKNGSIRVSTGTMSVDRDYLMNTLLAEDLDEGEYVYLEVRDTGQGMDLETQRRIFDPFFTTKLRGRGLGLAAVLGLVRRHGAALNVESAPGKGTSFRVLFPPVAGAMLRDIQSAPHIKTYKGDGVVLVIDDEEVVRFVSTEILEFAGFKVLSAMNGREGIELFEKRADQIILVLLDMTMPDMSGEEVFKEIRRLRPDARVLLSSGYSKTKAVDRLLNNGLAGYLQKPYIPEVLLGTIHNVLKDA